MNQQRTKTRSRSKATYLLAMALSVAGWGLVVPPSAEAAPAQDPKPGEPENKQPEQQPKPQPKRPTPRKPVVPKKTGEGDGTPGQEVEPPNVDPEVVRQIDDALQQEAARQREEARERAERLRKLRRGPQPSPEAQGEDEEDDDEAQPVPGQRRTIPRSKTIAVPEGMEAETPKTRVEIAAAEDRVPPEEKQYYISCKDCTYEQLIEGFARQTGLGVIGDVPKDGKVSFVTTEPLSFNEALGRIRVLLFNYKPNEPYYIDRQETHLEVLSVNDKYRKLTFDQMYASIEDFEKADPPDDELCLLIYTPKSGSVADLRIVRDFLPDYVRVTPLEDETSVTIYAIVGDIKKYLSLIPVFVRRDGDPRTLKLIELEYVTPTEAMATLQTLMSGGGAIGGGAAAAGRTRSARSPRQPSPLDTMTEPDVTMIPNDAHGTLLVKAMQDKIEEIESLLPFIDLAPESGDYDPAVIPVEHADITGLIETIKQILAFTGPPDEGATPSPAKRRAGVRRGGAGAGAAAAADGAVMFPHPTEQAIIVLGDEPSVDRIRELVKQFDVESGIGPVRLEVVHVDASDMIASLQAFLGGVPEAGKVRTPGPPKLNLIAAPNGDAIWYTGNERELEKVKELIAILDVPDDGVKLHVYQLNKTDPSFVASLLREFDRGEAVNSQPQAPTKPAVGRRARQVTVSKFTADDMNGRFYAICSDDEWAQYLPLIEQIEASAGDGPPFVRLPLAHLDPSDASVSLSDIYAPEMGIRFLPSDGAVLVLGASAATIEEIKVFLSELDTPRNLIERIFIIRHRPPEEIKVAIEALVGSGGTESVRRRPQPKSAAGPAPSVAEDLIIVQMTDRLLVQATESKMTEVARLIGELDVEDRDTEVRVYADFPPGADIEYIADTLAAMYGAPQPKRATGSVRGTGPEGPRFIPQSAAGRLVAVAPPGEFAKIEQLLEVLRTTSEMEPFVIDFISVTHADPEELVGLVAPLLDMKARQLVQEGRLQDLSEDPAKIRPAAKRPTQTGVTTDHYHMDADIRNQLVVISAPQELVDEARLLIERFDQPSESDGTCHRTTKLANADPAEVVKALKEMVATSSRTTNRRRAKPQMADETVADVAALTAVAVPGAQAVFLQGPCEAVDQAEEWVIELDAGSGGRVVKVYEIKRADIKQLADIILNVVDATPRSPGRKPAGRARAGASDEFDEDPWETSKTWQGAEVFIQADMVGRSMIVAAPGTKIARVDELVRMFDPEEGETVLDTSTKRVPMFFHDLVYVDALDASFNLESLLEMVWNPPDQVPDVEAAFFGNSLVIKYPDESRFDEIRALIRDRIDRPDPKDLETKRVMFDAPTGMTAAELAQRLKSKYNTEYDIEIVDITNRVKVEGLEVLKPYDPDKDNPCVLPATLTRLVDDLVLTTAALLEPEQDAPAKGPLPPPTVVERTPGQEEPPPTQDQDEMIKEAVRSKKAEKQARREKQAAEETGTERSSGVTPFRGAKLKIVYDDVMGTFVVEGPKGVIDDVPDWIDEIKESIDEDKVRPDIRIVRVRYIDVHQAAEILEEMFNATRQQRQMIQQQQRMQMQQQRMQAQQAAQRARQLQQQQQPQQGRGQQQPGREQPGQQQPQQQLQMPELPPTQVRVFPNPRDRTLILRADTSQYPAIFELLATIDRPQPINSEIEIFKLDKLDATEVEELLSSMLGLDVQSARRSASRSARGGARQAPTMDAGPELPQTIMAEMTAGTGSLGVNPDDIKLTSNEETNTIIAMAPPVALDFIRDIIKRLEDEQAPDRTARYYELKHADAEEVAEYLRTHFEQQEGTGGGGGGGAGGKRAVSAASVHDMPNFVAYPPQNLLTALATEEQFAEIDAIVARLDVPSDQDQWQHVDLVHADAKKVADALGTMFPGSTASSGRPGRPGRQSAAIGSAGGVSFYGEEGGRILFYSAPEGDREKILEIVARLEEQAKDTANVRAIQLKYADPTGVAEVLQEAFGASTGGRGQRGGGGASVPFTISAHDPSKQLFVVADDELFAKIEGVVAQLDSEDATLGETVRVVPLLYTDVAEMQTAIETYLAKPGQAGGRGQRGSGGELVGDVRISPLTQSNALVVSGSKTDVERIEGIIQQLDVAGEKGSVPQMIKLQHANALDVAATIEGLFPSAGGQRGGKSAVVVVANEAANSLLVKADRSDFTAIEALVAELDTEEEVQPNFRIVQVAAGVNVTEVAEDVEAAINKSIESRPSLGKNRVQPSITASADRRRNAILLAGSASLFDEAEKLIREIETLEPSGAQTMRIIQLGKVPASDIQQLIDQLKGDAAGSSGSSRRSGRSSTGNRGSSSPRRPQRRPGG